MAGENMDMEADMETGRLGNPAGRFAAGEDPAQREQMLACAWRVFKRKGFDAASMNDITQAAGVSNRSLSVLSPNPEDLFPACVV